MSYLVIDVREPYEYDTGHVKNAVNIPLHDLIGGTDELKDVSKDTQLIVYCRTGNRSGAAKEILENMGYTNVKNGINKQLVESNLKS